MGMANRRGNPDVVKKRRAARQFNEVLAELGASGPKRDGRTEKRRARMLEELREGMVRSTRKALKPIDVLTRVHDLLALGEPLAAIRKVCRPARSVPMSDEVIAGVKSLHEAYGFAPEIYPFVGLDEATLRRAGVLRGKSGPGLNPGLKLKPGLKAARSGKPKGREARDRSAA